MGWMIIRTRDRAEHRQPIALKEMEWIIPMMSNNPSTEIFTEQGAKGMVHWKHLHCSVFHRFLFPSAFNFFFFSLRPI